MSDLFKGPNFEPIPGTTPSTLENRKGCTWPVTFEGNTMYCDQPVEHSSFIKVRWCSHHISLGLAKRPTKPRKTVSKAWS